MLTNPRRRILYFARRAWLGKSYQGTRNRLEGSDVPYYYGCFQGLFLTLSTRSNRRIAAVG